MGCGWHLGPRTSWWGLSYTTETHGPNASSCLQTDIILSGMYGWKIWLSIPAFLMQLCGLLKAWAMVCTMLKYFSFAKQNMKTKTFMNKKRTKHFVKYGSIDIHCTMSLFSRVEKFSRVPTALCFSVVWMCCDFQGLIAFHTLWDQVEDSIHCASLTQSQSAFLFTIFCIIQKC